METTQHDSPYSWWRLALSLALSIVGSIGIWAPIVVLADMQADFGVTRAAASFPYTLTMVGFAAGNLLLGRVVDRKGMAPVLGGSALALALGFGGSALTQSVTAITALHVFVGAGAAACFGPLMADISLWFHRRRGIAVAVVASGNYLAGAFWPPIMVWVMESADGWRSAYLMLAVVVFLVLLPGATLLRSRIDAASTDFAAREAAANATATGVSPRTLQALLALAGIGCCVAMAMPQVHIVALCIDRGYGAQSGAQMLSLMLLGGVASRLAFGAFVDRFGGLMTLFAGGTLQMLTLCLFLLDGGLTTLYLSALIFGLSQGGIVPSYAIIVREYMAPQEAGKRVGLVIGATILGMALGGWMAGWIYDTSGSYRLAVWNGIAWNVLNISIALILLTRIGPRRAPA